MSQCSDFVLMTDSSCDLPPELAAELGLVVLPLTVRVEDKEFENHLDGRYLSFHDFYDKIRAGAVATTAAVNMDSFLQAMEPILASGRDVLYLAFSSGLSSTYQASALAAAELSAKYPQRTIRTVDTLCASMGQGLLTYLAAGQKAAGASLEEVCAWVECHKQQLCHWFTVDDLMFLKRGGRINAGTALAGTVLGIKPVLHVDQEGRLITMSKSRGRQASLAALVDRMAETALDPAGQVVFISHGDCLEDAQTVAELVKARFGVQRVVINYVGPVIGAHSGPGTLALFFLGSHR